MLHAREWASGSTLQYIFYALLKGSQDPKSEISKVLEQVDFHLVPFVNVDGYVYSWEQPENRLWRKNRCVTNQFGRSSRAPILTCVHARTHTRTRTHIPHIFFAQPRQQGRHVRRGLEPQL